jgi:hypothetical protein
MLLANTSAREVSTPLIRKQRMTDRNLSAKGLWRLTKISLMVNRQAGEMGIDESRT